MNKSVKFSSVSAPEWLWVVGIWLCFAMFDASQTTFVMHSEGMHHDWARVFSFKILSWSIWPLATPYVLRLNRRFPPARVWKVHLAFCIVIGMLSASWSAEMDLLIDPWSRVSDDSYLALLFDHFFNGILSDVVIYVTIVAIGYGLDSRERLILQEAETARLQTRLATAQLDALRRQIEPHFLFNTLNTVTGLVRENKNGAAIGMIVGISDLLRRVLDESDRQLISLGEELAFLEKYFAIQKIRFAERLTVQIAVPEQLLSTKVPGMLLQPIVENAFKHGLVNRVQGGLIRISATTAEGLLTLRIYNDGPKLPEQRTEGIGYSNARERLKGLYGDRYQLNMEDHDDGVEVVLTMPIGEPDE